MPAQSVNWGQRPSKKSAAPASSSNALDNFVSPTKDKVVRRLNLNIPAGLHARIKARCAMESRDMTEVLTQLLEERFPEAVLK